MLNFERDVLYYSFDSFKEINFIRHCFSTKVGGISKDEFSELNLGFNRGDSNVNVLINFFLQFKAVGLSGNMVSSKQVHDKKVFLAKKEDMYKNLEGYDSFVTKEKKLMLTTFHADCIPVFFVDIKKQVIGLAHSGWRGTLANISIEVIKKMQNEFLSSLEDIRIGIGPSICLECFEVDEDVLNLFKNKYNFINEYFFEKGEKFHLDLKNIIKKNLIDYGIQSNQIEVSGLCTKCREDLFYSHRRDGIKRGSMAAFIELR